MSRFVRTYDANGRILEEKQILENPALLIADAHFNAAQLEAMNRVMKSMVGGQSDAGKTYAYDAQGRLTEMRSRNFGFDEVKTISYNEHGDKSAEHATMTSNLSAPPTWHSQWTKTAPLFQTGTPLNQQNRLLYLVRMKFCMNMNTTVTATGPS